MGFGQAISTCFQKYATFGGRARRSEYWFFILFNVLAGFATGIVDGAVFGSSLSTSAGLSPLSTILTLALLLPNFAVLVRRLHDTGWSGWWVGGLYALLLVAAVLIGVSYAAYQEHALTQAGFGVMCLVLGLAVCAYAVWMFVLTVLDGHRGPNQYGPDPKGPDTDVFS